MNTQNSTNLTAAEAQKILKKFSCTDVVAVESDSEKALLRDALLAIANLADYLNLGICAYSAEEAFEALENYLKGLEIEIPLDRSNIPAIEGPIYLKFNTNKQSYYLDSYTGKYRGVLVSCQSSVNDDMSGTYGHLPLDLFT